MVSEPAGNKYLKFYQDENLDKYYYIATEKWELIKLLSDLEKIKIQFDQKLGKFEKIYLCLLLADQKPQDIAKSNIYSPSTLNTQPTKTGLYDNLRELTGEKINDWRDIIIALVNKGYRRTSPTPTNTSLEKQAIVIIKIEAEISESLLTELENNMKKMLGANKVMLNHLEKGCIKSYWQGSQSDCEQINNLHQQGLLSERLGVTILSVEVRTLTLQKVTLTQWFTGILTAGWRNAEELLTPQQLNPVYSVEPIKKAKIQDLVVDLITYQVILAVNILRESENKIIINPKVYPYQQDTLPENLKLVILSEGKVFQEITARGDDLWIQCEFDGEVGEEFTIQLILGDQVISEDFVI